MNLFNILNFISDNVPKYKISKKDDLIKIPFSSGYRDENLLKQGEHISYHKNGKIHKIRFYVDGKLNGKFLDYFPNGMLEIEGNMENHLLNGILKIYSKNGNLNTQSKYKNGKKHGLSINYHANGQIRTKDYFDDGLPHGERKMYSKSGELEGHYIYDKGNLIKILK